MIFLQNFLIDFFLIFFPIAFLARNQKRFELKKTLKELGIGHIEKGFFFKKTTALFLKLFAVAFIVGLVLVILGINDTKSVFQTINAIKESNIILLFYLLFTRVIAEEIFFRGFLAAKTGIFFSSVVFAAAHVLYGSIAEIIGTFFLGLVLASTFLKNKNLMPNIFAHIFYNLFVLILAYSVAR